jgi:membrane associated rhomboid family serine protease
MGISNRDYYRDDPPPFEAGGGGGGGAYGGPSLWSIKSLLIICVGVFFLQNLTAEPGKLLKTGITPSLSLSWRSLLDFEVWRIVSYGFTHDGMQHLFFNMLGLWILGRMVEGIYGSKEFVAFFVAAVIVSGLVQVGVTELANVMSDNPHPSPGIIGASGGVLAVVLLAALHFPHQPMQLFLIPISFELRWMAAFYVGLDIMMVLTNSDTGVAHLAHLAGAGFGVLYFKMGWRIISTSQSGSRGSFFKKRLKSKPKPKSNPNVKIYEPPADLDREVDRILDKINSEGRESLTSDEERVLMRASEKYQKSRDV